MPRDSKPNPLTPEQTTALDGLLRAQAGAVSPTQLAEILGVTRNTVQKRAVRLKAPRVGNGITLSRVLAFEIAAQLRDPSKRGPKPRALA